MRWTHGGRLMFLKGTPPASTTLDTEPKVTITIRLSPELHARLVAAAQERLVSVTWLTNRAIEHFLDNLLPPDEFTLTK